MKLLHAATLSLLGWYLIAPPARLAVGTAATDAATPLVKWQVVSKFDTANECETGRLQWQAAAASGKLEPLKRAISQERCVSADDPRLKPK